MRQYRPGQVVFVKAEGGILHHCRLAALEGEFLHVDERPRNHVHILGPERQCHIVNGRVGLVLQRFLSAKCGEPLLGIEFDIGLHIHQHEMRQRSEISCI